MSILNIEFKAKVENYEPLETLLLTLNPQFIGTDLQIDTYFNVQKGRLKLREGNIENALIFYERSDVADSKSSKILLYKHNPEPILKNILANSNGIKVIVKKLRKIYFIDNVKFHFDEVEGLGHFIEVEAIDENGTIGEALLKEQCEHYADFFSIQKENYVSVSYSDLLLG